MNLENEFDYEDMDDLALPSQIEWNNDATDSFTLEALDMAQW